MARIKATVISQKGHCAAGHKMGDETVFDWDTNEIEGKMCLHMMYSVLPKVFAFAHGAKVAWATAEDGEKVSRHACPDGANPVIVELRKLD